MSGLLVSQQFALTGAEDTPFSGVVATDTMIVKALSSNVAVVAIGNTGCTTANAYQLDPGESIAVDFLNPTKIKAKGSAADRLCIFGTLP